MPNLSNHVAIVSGGIGDIGRAICLALARAGADVAVSDILPPESAQPLLAEIATLGRRARYDRVDVSDAAAGSAWIDAVETDLGPPRLIVPTAATVKVGDILELDPAAWERELAINLNGSFFMAQAAARRLLAQNLTGRIVMLGSWVGEAVFPHIPAYCASKAGVRMLMKCLALRLAPHGITVNEVAPGYVDAGLSKKIFDEQPGRREAAAAQIPNKTLISAEEVAAQVLHLCNPANRHMTGSIILMDGGLSLTNAGVV